MRCGTLGTSGHVTIKSSIHVGVCFINPASTRDKDLFLTLGDLSCVSLLAGLMVEQSILIAWEKSAEGIVGGKKQTLISGSMDEL